MAINLPHVLHETLVVTGHVECCAIFKRKDFSVKATSVGYQPSFEQVKALIEAFDNTYTSRDNNIHFNGATYRCIKADKNSIYATKGDSGFICVKTDSFLVFGSYSSQMYPSVCSEAVEKLGDYLSEKGL